MIDGFYDFINESFKKYNKKIDYEIISEYSLDDATLDHLNSFCKGWIIIDPELDEYIINIIRWENKFRFEYKNYYTNDKLIMMGNSNIYNLDKDKKNTIIKVDVKGPKVNRRISEIDPFGEEDWDE